MPNQKLIKKLEDWGVDYELLKHKTVYTAHDVAATLKKKLDEIAKTLIVEADKTFYFVALPANKNLDFKKLKKAIEKIGGKVRSVSIPSEKAIVSKLKIRPGQITGFGSVHNLNRIVDKDLTRVKRAVFSAGQVTESIFMAIKDYLKVEEPKVEIIGVKKKFKKPKKAKTVKPSKVSKKSKSPKRKKR